MRDRFEAARMRDYREYMKAMAPEYGIGEPHAEPAQLGDSVGAMMEVAIKLAGGNIVDRVGGTFCETDYLAASGATFPVDVTREEMEEFNLRTLKPDMNEADEMARYAFIYIPFVTRPLILFQELINADLLRFYVLFVRRHSKITVCHFKKTSSSISSTIRFPTPFP